MDGQRTTDVIGRLKHLDDLFRFDVAMTRGDMTNIEIAELADDAIVELRLLFRRCVELEEIAKHWTAMKAELEAAAQMRPLEAYSTEKLIKRIRGER